MTQPLGQQRELVAAEQAFAVVVLAAVAYVDAPDTTDQAAVQYRGRINSGRIFVCDPKVLKFDTDLALNVPEPSSPIFAARQAKMDLEQGFWWAGSNVEAAGIVGTNRPIEYGAQSNYLNENRVNTIVNIDNTGFRLWGVWTCDSDPLWQFVTVRRTADAINEALEKAYLEFVDRPFTKANLKFMIEAGRAFLRAMEMEGAILPGHDAWLLDSNTETELAQGIVKLGVKFEPPAPMVDIRLTSYRNIVSLWRGNSFVTKRDQLCHSKMRNLILSPDATLCVWRGASFWTKTDYLLDTKHFVLARFTTALRFR